MCPREAELQHRDPAPLESRRRESKSGSFNPLFREPSLKNKTQPAWTQPPGKKRNVFQGHTVDSPRGRRKERELLNNTDVSLERHVA